MGETYDDACDAYYFNTFMGNDCTPGGNDCAALNSGTVTFCCFTPKANSFCDQDYGGVSQCVPK